MKPIQLPASSEALIKEARAFHLKKRLGQHFLIDVSALSLIADTVGATAGDTVIEVGPGIGFLTRFLAASGGRIIAVELDRESISTLQSHDYPNVEIKHGDFLRFDLSKEDFFRRRTRESEQISSEIDEISLGQPEVRARQLKIVGNVPYQITGLIIGHLLGEIDKPAPWLPLIDTIVMTVQYEVAKRMVANAGDKDYSRVSLLVQYFCEPSLVSVLPADSFYPPPEVKSAIVKLMPRKQPAVSCSNPQLLRQIINAGFKQRRKMLKNDLSFLKMTQKDIDQVFREHQIDPQVRAERLSLAQFAMLTEAFSSHVQKHADNQSNSASQS